MNIQDYKSIITEGFALKVANSIIKVKIGDIITSNLKRIRRLFSKYFSKHQ